ncbi:MAG: DedA family protein [Thermomicrobiales bacterium]|nr:DedA family protein [Thermomicrobiales bacterium]MCO5222174.1 DedA family protein [Thermomicrobiales bacterium]
MARNEPYGKGDTLFLLQATDQSTSELTGIADWAVRFMERLGAPGAGVLIALENLFPPLPSEVILPLAGFTASRGDFELWEALFWTTLGSVIGALILYGIGAALGMQRTIAIAERLPLINTSDIDKTVAWFQKHGPKAVFFGRMLPIFRSLISIPAGIERMPLTQFVPLTLAGSLIWNSIFVVAGYQLGENWHRVERYAEFLQYIVIAAVAVAVLIFIVRRLRAQRSAPGSAA